MASTESRPRSAVRLFAVYAVVSAVAVLLMGLALASSYRSEANRRGVAEGATEAQIVATTAVEPLLDGTPLEEPLSPSTVAALKALSSDQKTIARLRVRDLEGKVLFSDDGSGTQRGGGVGCARGGTGRGRGRAHPAQLRRQRHRSGRGPGRRGLPPARRGTGQDHASVSSRSTCRTQPIRADIDAGMHGLYIEPRRLACSRCTSSSPA